MRSLMNSRRRFAACIFLSAASVANAQNIRATVTGRVTDASGASVPGASITITSLDTNQSRKAVTAQAGDYVLPQLEPGSYTLAAEREGFRREVTKKIVLETGQEYRIDIALQVGAVTETVEVEASAPLINADNSNIGGVVEQRKIVELPLNGRNYLQLAVLQPNVLPAVQGSANANRGGLNIAGASEVSNLYVKDGIDNNSASDGASHTPILDTVREFKVLTGTYSAEYGRASGAQVMVTTKSGANEFHGAAWEFHRNSAFDARNFFSPGKPPFRRNQFGAVTGGRIRRDKTFFFLGY
ncbi:MAG: carboxypeptidase regulatory-like domain-containing protein [Acidobacteria bacterium]|nr:carboxypeptidase regulatory-like domain-containing protein [Acidobacteriota bacterium]